MKDVLHWRNPRSERDITRRVVLLDDNLCPRTFYDTMEELPGWVRGWKYAEEIEHIVKPLNKERDRP